MRLPRILLAVLNSALALSIGSTTTASKQPAPFDVVIRGGTVYDGTGAPGRRADIGLRGDRIAAIGDLASLPASAGIDASGLAVAPGFINMIWGVTPTIWA